MRFAKCTEIGRAARPVPIELSIWAALIFTALVGAGDAGGQTVAPLRPSVPSMTLPEAPAWARAHQPAIRSARARLAVREREARVPRAQWMPQVGATAQILYGT